MEEASRPGAAEYYSVAFGPALGEVHLCPGVSYRLDMAAPALQAPSADGLHHQAVLSSEEREVLVGRGFEIQVMGGPFASEQAAADVLDDWWEDSHRLGGDVGSRGSRILEPPTRDGRGGSRPRRRSERGEDS